MARERFLRSLRLLAETYQAFERLSDRHVRELGLTPAQFDIVATLGNTDGMPFRELGERTLITKGTLTGVLDRMEARGLIARRVDASDARRAHVSLTRKGTLLFEDVFPAHLQHLQRAFGRLSESELKHLRESLSQLQDAFEKEHAR